MPADAARSGPRIPVSKYQSYGNDFLIVASEAVPQSRQSAFSAAVCDRCFGLGADGCIFVAASPPDDFSMVLYNQDGSLASMSGNGGRCACAFLHDKQLACDETIPIRSSAGVRHYRLLETRPGLWRYRSAMGEPDFSARAVPAAAADPDQELLDHRLDVGNREVRISALWVGNPQCIVVSEELPGEGDFALLGGGLATHDFFPEGTNVGFVRVDGPNALTLKVWERGVGPTWSSGTGSCAGAVVAIRQGLTRSPVVVSTETGSQRIEWEAGAQMQLEGETRFVADCRFYWPDAG